MYIKNFLTNQLVKEFWKSVHICQSCKAKQRNHQLPIRHVIFASKFQNIYSHDNDFSVCMSCATAMNVLPAYKHVYGSARYWLISCAGVSCRSNCRCLMMSNDDKKLSYRREAAQCFVSLNISLSQSRSLFFLSFFLIWGGTRSLRMPALRPASQAGPMRNPREGTSVVLRDTIRLTWWCVYRVFQEKSSPPWNFLEYFHFGYVFLREILQIC